MDVDFLAEEERAEDEALDSASWVEAEFDEPSDRLGAFVGVEGREEEELMEELDEVGGGEGALLG